MEKSPCNRCYRKKECCGLCDRWKEWFSRRWRNIQQAAVLKYGPIKGIDLDRK